MVEASADEGWVIVYDKDNPRYYRVEGDVQLFRATPEHRKAFESTRRLTDLHKRRCEVPNIYQASHDRISRDLVSKGK